MHQDLITMQLATGTVLKVGEHGQQAKQLLLAALLAAAPEDAEVLPSSGVVMCPTPGDALHWQLKWPSTEAGRRHRLHVLALASLEPLIIIKWKHPSTPTKEKSDEHE